MITYEIKKDSSDKPSLTKVITVSPTEKYLTVVNTAMPSSEIDNISTSKILEHCEELLAYIKKLIDQNVRIINLDEKRGDYHETLWGWAEVLDAKREYDEWWSYAFYNREPEE